MKKILVIGLGSMGQRRIRCLQSLGYFDITGVDVRQDRIENAKLTYKINTASAITNDIVASSDAIIISTPPDQHTKYVKMAIDHNKPVFVEGSVLLDEVLEVKKHNKTNVFVAPSCTLRFHPVVKDIGNIIKDGRYGKVTNFSYHSGQYLPDWHPWENVQDFYVSNRATGGAREIVPFELTWIVDTFGWPSYVKGYFRKTADVGADIDDTYAFSLNYKDKIGHVLVDVVSRYAVRNLIVNLERGQIQWRWDEGSIKIFEAEKQRWINMYQPEFAAAEGYNANIGEKMYVDEVQLFLEGITDRRKYPNTVDDDIRVLKVLKKIEDSDGGF